MPDSKASLGAWTREWTVWLIFSAFLLLPVGRTVELPTLIMAIGGLAILVRHGNELRVNPGQKLFGLMFLCIWLPMAISLVDAVNPEKTAKDVFTFLRLYLAGVFIIWTLALPERRKVMLKLTAAMVAFWVADALLQASTGTNLFGYQHTPPRLNGIYGERHLDLGISLPTLAPLLLFSLRQNLILAGGASLLTGTVIIMAGSRGGWVSFGLTLVLLAIYELRRRNWRWHTISLALAILASASLAFMQTQPETQKRLETTLTLFSGNWDRMNEATAYRLQIWETAARMFDAHQLNGVGVGGFRYAYPDHALPGDGFVDHKSGTGAFYAHQLLVQVGSETGLTGLAGLLFFFAIWGRSWQRSTPDQQAASLPFGLAALAWLFPLNTHASFYSSQWSQLIWLLLALYCTGLTHRQHDSKPTCPA